MNKAAKAAADGLAVIPARGGSKGVPRKAERLVAGVPLLARTIRAATQARSVARVIVSTDDTRYAALAREHGAEVPFLRPAHLATDHASMIDVMVDLLARLAADGFALPEWLVLLQPTSPFTTGEDIDQARCLADGRADAVVSVCRSDVQPDWLRRPDAEGWLAPLGSLDVKQHTPRQAMPTTYRLNGALYWVRTRVFLAERTFLPRCTRHFEMPLARSLDIDSPFDLELANWLAGQVPEGRVPQSMEEPR